MRRATLQYGQSYKKGSWSAEEGGEREVGQLHGLNPAYKVLAWAPVHLGVGSAYIFKSRGNWSALACVVGLVVGLPNILVGKNCSHHVVETGENKR
jgi:hypothetical protein